MPPGGASSTYGADAVSGVVNFIMDTNFEGIRFDGQYSFYQHTNRDRKVGINHATGADVSMYDILDARIASGLDGYSYPTGSVTDGGAFDGNVAIGAGFDDGRGHVTAYFGYRNVNPVLQSRRDYSVCTIQNRAHTLRDAAGNPVGEPIRQPLNPNDTLNHLSTKFPSPKLWNAETPNLYTLDVTLGRGDATPNRHPHVFPSRIAARAVSMLG